MYSCDNYGVVYTPKNLAAFVADLMLQECIAAQPTWNGPVNILDPACGEGILLKELNSKLNGRTNLPFHCIGIDVDSKVITSNRCLFPSQQYTFIPGNTIIPSSRLTAYSYWSHRLKDVSCVIANPPWSSEKIFSREDLDRAGYRFDVGQYDSYVLFIELCLKLVKPNGLLAFIVPDSLFFGENKALREFLLKNTEIRILARLGEKLFHNVNRATSVIVLKKCKPTANTTTRCYRLDTADRKKFLDGNLTLYENFLEKSHAVVQKRFLDNQGYIFDIDTREGEEALLKKIVSEAIDWKKVFRFGRGVEISKSGSVITCGNCGLTQVYLKKQLGEGSKKCQFCKKEILLTQADTFPIIFDSEEAGLAPIYVGENLHRYKFDGIRYIKPGVNGINYKDKKQYRPPKILVRKTGLGIYACIDYQTTYTSQTVYSLTLLDDKPSIPLEYYLGVLNSRLIYYYYLKKYGENEWKSHPYLTKDIIFSLPVRAVSQDNMGLALQIAESAKQLQYKYSRKLDMQLEKMVMRLYHITKDELALIEEELNALPDLSAVEQMKLKDGELDV